MVTCSRHEELCDRSFYKKVIYKMSWQRLNLDGLQMTENLSLPDVGVQVLNEALQRWEGIWVRFHRLSYEKGQDL